ncbi:hypothetical protein OG21DRAFT_1518033 [Imleria badia]|nr:hypothetical protein OG21DRAFT_1518033 [Imleria badia]
MQRRARHPQVQARVNHARHHPYRANHHIAIPVPIPIPIATHLHEGASRSLAAPPTRSPGPAMFNLLASHSYHP